MADGGDSAFGGVCSVPRGRTAGGSTEGSHKSSGAGQLSHFYDALTEGKAEAVLAASLFHYKELEIRQVKEYLRERGISVRL